MSFETIILGAVGIIPLVLGIVEAAKRIGINDKGSFVLALMVGTILAGVREAMAQGLIPPGALPFIAVVIAGVGGGLAATGLYDLAKRFLGK